MRSWGRIARTSAAIRVRRPLSLQMDPEAACTLEFVALTRSKYDNRDAAATLSFGSAGLRALPACARSEGTDNIGAKVRMIQIARMRSPPVCGCSVIAASPHPTVHE